MYLRSILIFLLVSSSTLLFSQKRDTLFRGPNKEIASITTTKKNKKTIVRYHNQKKIASEENYLNDKLHGLVKKYNYGGILEEETEYKEGKKNGYSKEFYGNSTIKAFHTYKNDTLHGLQIKYYDIGTFQSKENYVNGQRIGICEYYFKSGKISGQHSYDTTYQEKGSKKEKTIVSELDGRSQVWYESGYQKSDDNYIKGKRDGISKEWYENGKLKYVHNYNNEGRTGRQLNYHQNGNLSEDMTIILVYDSIKKYYATLYEGEFLKFDEHKNPLIKGFYKNKKKHGKWQEFQGGKITTDAEYKSGYMINTLKVYHQNSDKLSRIVQYKETTLNSRDTSLIHGETIGYFQNGSVAYKQIVRNGKIISNQNYNENGTLHNFAELKDSLAYITSYHKNGKIANRSVAKYDSLKDIGSQKFQLITSYYENGQIKQEHNNSLSPVKFRKEYNDSGAVTFQKYHLLNDIGIETDFYPSGKLRSENLVFMSHYKVPGIQYVEWFENGKPKRFEKYGFYQINWLSNGEFYNSFTYTNNNFNTPKDTTIDPAYVREVFQSLSKSEKRMTQLENIEGKTCSTYDSKKVKIEAFIEDGRIDRYVKAYYYSGKPMIEFTLKDGKLDGPYKLYLKTEM